jgi:molecular chaperone DnaK
MEKVIGIDLGTTNSCVAIFENGRPVVIPNKGGYKTTPSIVAIAENGKRLVGHIAKRQAVTNAENTVFAAKRLIGRPFDAPEVRRTLETCPYQIVPGPGGDVRVRLASKDYAIPEISAAILGEMKRIAEEYVGEPVNQAVVTVPAYFNDGQRQATKDAGVIAGLEILRIINEPTAAALAYGFEKKVDKKIAVFDLGGGTFDISILEIGDGVFEVLATAGDTFLGGDDFDARIIDWLADEFLQEHGIDLRQDKMALQRLKDEAEKAKCELSFSTRREISLPFIATQNQKALHLKSTLSREQLESLVDDLVERCIRICAHALRDAGLRCEDVEDVILVGGMTRMPMLQRRVQEFFGRAPSKGVHPDEVVALGAAIQANVLVDDKMDMLLLDVTPMSLGIATVGGNFSVLIPRNTTIPTQKSHLFTTANDNQTTVKIVVLQGESNQARENQLLGEFLLTGIRKMPKGMAEIDVNFSIDADGIVSVAARDRDTGKEQSITVTYAGGLDEDELNRMIDEQKEYAVRERDSADMANGINQIQSLSLEISKLLPKAERLLGAPGVQSVQRKLNDARQAIDSQDMARIQSTRQELERSLTTLQGMVTP